MPNWNSNSLTIKETKDNLIKQWWIIELQRIHNWKTIYEYIFNLHKLFPDKFPEEYHPCREPIESKWTVAAFTAENTFDKYYDREWYIENIWTKWFWEMEYDDVSVEWHFFSMFETAWSPPTHLLDTFHRLSWIDFELDYEEPWMWFEWTQTWENWIVFDDEREYKPYCAICEEKNSEVDYCPELWDSVCPECLEKQWSTCCWATIRNWICISCKEHNEWYQFEE